jgi:hypothetical protein
LLLKGVSSTSTVTKIEVSRGKKFEVVLVKFVCAFRKMKKLFARRVISECSFHRFAKSVQYQSRTKEERSIAAHLHDKVTSIGR